MNVWHAATSGRLAEPATPGAATQQSAQLITDILQNAFSQNAFRGWYDGGGGGPNNGSTSPSLRLVFGGISGPVDVLGPRQR